MVAGGTRWFEDVVRGRRALPVWLQVAFVLIAVQIVFQTAAERDWAWGAVAALSYGYVAIANSVARNRVREWTRRSSERGNYLHSLILMTAFLFVALSSVQSLSTAASAAVAGLGGVTTSGIVLFLRGRRAA